MTNLEFSINLTAPQSQLIKLATDYENFTDYLPKQLEYVKILEKKDDQTFTEEKIIISSYIKKTIIQKTIHENPLENKLSSHIISGPLKGSTIDVLYETIESGTKISVKINLKLSLAYKILEPIIKKQYKLILMGIFYKMNALALEAIEK